MKAKHLMDYVVEHASGGGGYVIVEELPHDDVRICSVGPDGTLNKQAFVAWTKKLTREKRFIDPMDPKQGAYERKIPAEWMPRITQLRNDLKNGVKKVVSSHIKNSV